MVCLSDLEERLNMDISCKVFKDPLTAWLLYPQHPSMEILLQLFSLLFFFILYKKLQPLYIIYKRINNLCLTP